MLGIFYIVETKEAEVLFVPSSSQTPVQKSVSFSTHKMSHRSQNDSARGKHHIQSVRSHFKETIFSHVEPEPNALEWQDNAFDKL